MLYFNSWSALRSWVLCTVVVLSYLLPGTLGHDPWKQDETYTFGIIQHMLESGDLVVPTNAGQPFVEKPPLYAWVAVGLAFLLGDLLPLHDAARLASALFAGIAFFFLARTAKTMVGAHSWLDPRVLGTVVLCASSPIVVKHTHDMITDVALLAGTAIGFCGLLEGISSIVQRHPASRSSVFMLGAGAGLALLAKGVFIPLVFGVTLIGALALFPACRSNAYLRFLRVATLVFLPFSTIWPALLWQRSEALFSCWLWDNNIGRFLGFSVPMLGAENDDPLYVWRSLLTIAFPLGPLVLLVLARGWRYREFSPAVALPVIFTGVGLIVLQLSATGRPLYLLPFTIPLALLAVHVVERLPQRLHIGWDYLSRLLFGIVVASSWMAWFTMTQSSSREPVRWLEHWLPINWTMPVHPMLLAVATVLTAGWFCYLPLLRHAGKWRGALSWGSGMLVGWGLVATLLLPWLDLAKSYRSVFEQLQMRLAPQWANDDCMASLHLGESEAPMLHYFTGILHHPVARPDALRCRWLIVQSTRTQALKLDNQWGPFWTGARPSDESELLTVFLRAGPRSTDVAPRVESYPDRQQAADEYNQHDHAEPPSTLASVRSETTAAPAH